ncbi:hypothetical protein D3C79_1086290 [compost metagenome]
MVTVDIPYRVDFSDTDIAGNVLDHFNQQASGAQAFEVLGDVPVDGQRPVALDAFMNALDGTYENAQFTFR